jgi:ferredoxin-NADP reductase
MADHLFALKDRREIAPGTMAFWFDTSGSGYRFRAGQNADFTLIDPPMTDAEGNVRTFSFASSPLDTEAFMVATRMRNTAFKNSLKSVPLGTKVKVSDPMGSFTLHKDTSKPAVFLAGGIGITPSRSIIEWATGEKLSHKLFLFYSNQVDRGTPFLSDFEKWAKEYANFKFIPTLTGEKQPSWRYESGVINKEMLTKHLSAIPSSIYYLAGPPGMVAAMRKLIDELGVSEDNVKTEDFAGY